ncbi:cell division protein SepF [Candidatus Nanohalococcus occultus]|uniref:Cell division protein, SepF-like n=1 Tax=Candidatus Nanohalococcus occultus TaxID=2978047 RepID=A0ABY8CHH6_9ARCH|nr:Putative cell division protein, SepF-like [Candidatus Nanohaloarchaeota archaeon SVXNc]
MPLDFLKKSESTDEENVVDDDFVELDAKTVERSEDVVIRAETLKEYEDVDKVQEHLRNESIVWVNIRPLKNKEMADLKRAVNRLKKTVKAVDGDMAGVDEEWIVVCPNYASIERSGKMGEKQD